MTAKTEAIETNLVTTDWKDLYIQILTGARDRAFATQFKRWDDPAPFQGYPGDPPLVAVTNVGGWVLVNTNLPLFRFDTNIIEIVTNTIFDLGTAHPAQIPTLKASWDGTMLQHYKVVPPLSTTYAVVSNVGFYIREAITNAFLTNNVGQIFTNVVFTNLGVATVTNLTSHPEDISPLIRAAQIAESDEAIYEAMSWYGDEFEQSNIVFEVFDQDSYDLLGQGEKTFAFEFPFVEKNVLRSRDKFIEWGIGDTNFGLFTRYPINTYTSIPLAELIMQVTNTFDDNGTNKFVIGWKPNILGEFMFDDPFTGNFIQQGVPVSFNREAVISNTIIVAGVRPNLTFTVGDTNNTTLFENTTVSLTGNAMDIEDVIFSSVQFGRFGKLRPVTESTSIFSSSVPLTRPYATIDLFSSDNNPIITTNANFTHLGDVIRVEWNFELPKFGQVSFPIFKRDIIERYTVLTNMTILADGALGWVSSNSVPPINYRVGLQTSNTWANTTNGAITRFAANQFAEVSNNIPEKWVQFQKLSAVSFRADARHTIINAELDSTYIYTNIPRTVKFYAEANVMRDAPAKPTGLPPPDPQFFLGGANAPSSTNTYESNGSIFSISNTWFVFETNSIITERVITGSVFVGSEVFAATNPPVFPPEPTSIKAVLDSIGYIANTNPTATIKFDFTNAVDPLPFDVNSFP